MLVPPDIPWSTVLKSKSKKLEKNFGHSDQCKHLPPDLTSVSPGRYRRIRYCKPDVYWSEGGGGKAVHPVNIAILMGKQIDINLGVVG